MSTSEGYESFILEPCCQRVRSTPFSGTLSKVVPLPAINMTQSTRHTLTVLLLLVYASLSLTVGLLHTDQACIVGAGDTCNQTKVVNGSARAVGNSFCFACIFSTAQHLQRATPPAHISTCQATVVRFDRPKPNTILQPKSARAPPFPSFS